nr:MAG TPA: Major capsid protein [Caudoviricetes sp.]
MKNMNMKERYWTMNLQLFAGDGGDDDLEDEGGEDDDDDPGDDDDDSDDDEPEENEKKFSQKDVDDAVKKRLAREKRKWQRDQQKKAGKKPNGKVKTGEDSSKDDDAETQELRDKAAKADEMEMKWTCLEHDVDKACVDDVLALARVHMAKDEDMDIEDAIDEVLKKYPQFKESSKEEDDEEETKSKSWGQRQNGRRQKTSGVEAAFYARNPGLKND